MKTNKIFGTDQEMPTPRDESMVDPDFDMLLTGDGHIANTYGNHGANPRTIS